MEEAFGKNVLEEEISALDISLESNSSFAIEEEDAYTKVKVLGRGAFGEAVLYRKTITNELIVWKEINLQRADEKERNNALNEIEILSQLDHVNIVAYYNDFFDGASLFIEMEYANDGSLHHKIMARNGKYFEESEVILYFYQLISSVAYIHNIGILHRDIKTLNIFMNKNKLIKLGDFGISKVLEETYGNAQTCVGTPYYMSPELVKGDPYDQKSDVWACGCVLYELLTLSKVFDGTNQLKLIMSILEKDYTAVSDTYSIEIRNIVTQLLQKEASNRPFAKDTSNLSIFDEAKQFVNSLTTVNAPLRRISSQRSLNFSQSSAPVVSTLTSDVFYWGGGKQIPQKLQLFTEGNSGMHVAAGFSHFAVVTIEKELYTWANIQGGTEIVGQLGHGNTAMYRVPKKVEFFDGIPIKQVCCGDDFTIILTESGEVFACGSDYFGCIGCGNAHGEKVLTPVKIDTLKGIMNISCGDSHVIARTTDGNIYSWGCGEMGRLGLGDENDFSTPQLVKLPKQHSTIVSIACGRDNTLILTSNGQLLAFGSNEYNKMALNQIIHFRNKNTENDIVHYTLHPIPVRALRSYKLVSVSSGKTHSAVVDEYGRLLTFGFNKYGQLGVGDFKARGVPCLVRGQLSGKEVMHISCGNGFTIAATKDNQLYSWGRVENGRLGIDITGKKNVSIPKAIFGSLHRVASLSSRHWNSIILAEKILTSKTMATKSLSIKEELEDQFDIKNSTSNFDASDSFQFNAAFDSTHATNKNDATKDELPPWLVDELNDAEYISVEKKESTIPPKNVNTNEDTEVPAWLVDQWDKDEFIPMEKKNDESEDPVFVQFKEENQPSVRNTFRSIKSSSTNGPCSKCSTNSPTHLEVKVKELELENQRLNKLMKEQELLISTLRKERDSYKKCTNKLFALSKNVV